MLNAWEIIKDQIEYRSRIFNIVRRTSEHPQQGRADFFVIDTRDWVNVIAVTPQNEMLMVEQYRHGIDEFSLEIPGGVIDDGESPKEAAQRELLEETGYEGEQWFYLGKSSSNAAIMNNWTHTWLATGCRARGFQNLDEHEEIKVSLIPKKKCLTMLREGVIHHSVVQAAFAKWLTWEGNQ